MLKFVASPIVGYFAFFIGGAIAKEVGISTSSSFDGPTTLIGVITGIVATIFTFNMFPKKSVKESVADSVSFVKNTKNGISEMVNEDDSGYYAIAEQEIIDGEMDKGLWSQALVAAEGDESKRKIEYMKLRVKQLKRR